MAGKGGGFEDRDGGDKRKNIGQVCLHQRRQQQYKECGGKSSQICEHKRIRSRCLECGGSQI